MSDALALQAGDAPSRTSLAGQRACIWAMVAAGVGIAATMVAVAGWIPLPSPDQSAQEVARAYADDTDRIRILAASWAALWALWVPFSGVIAAQLAPREHGFPFWTLVSFGGGLLLAMIVILAAVLWAAASFRPDRDPETTQALHDVGFLLFLFPAGPFAVQILATGLVALGDTGAEPPLPRWFGYASIWLTTLTLPGFLVIFFKDGPLAWDGVVAFWIPAVAVGIWATLIIVLLLRHLARVARSPA